jgi:hypothetical protein
MCLAARGKRLISMRRPLGTKLVLTPDTSIEMWKWDDLRGDKEEVFALQSY